MSRRKSSQYYGYAFRVGKQQKTWFFVGLYRADDEIGACLTLNPDEHELIQVTAYPLHLNQKAMSGDTIAFFVHEKK